MLRPCCSCGMAVTARAARLSFKPQHTPHAIPFRKRIACCVCHAGRAADCWHILRSSPPCWLGSCRAVYACTASHCNQASLPPISSRAPAQGPAPDLPPPGAA